VISVSPWLFRKAPDSASSGRALKTF